MSLRRAWGKKKAAAAGSREARPAPGSPPTEAAPEGAPAHLPGRAHLVFANGGVVEAELDPETRSRVQYLARRVVAPPPPADGGPR